MSKRDKELKKAIIKWFFDCNDNELNKVCNCIKYFRPYIYDKNGNYLIGGKDVSDFIEKTEKLIYHNEDFT
jgi:hypothetical protein